jgi:hypothetical protein
VSVTLINHSGRCLALNLPHAAVCVGEVCHCTLVAGRAPRRICRSLSLPATSALTGLPESFLSAPEVSALVARGDLEVRRHPQKSQADAASAPKRPRRKRGESP